MGSFYDSMTEEERALYIAQMNAESDIAYKKELGRLKSLQDAGKIGADGYPIIRDKVTESRDSYVDAFNRGYAKTEGKSWYNGEFAPSNFPRFDSNKSATYGPNPYTNLLGKEALVDRQRALQNRLFQEEKASLMKAEADAERLRNHEINRYGPVRHGSSMTFGDARGDVYGQDPMKLPKMDNRVDNMFSNQMPDVGTPGYNPVQHTPNTGGWFDASLGTAGITHEDFNKLPDEKKSSLRRLMSDEMFKYQGLPSGGEDTQGSLSGLSKLMSDSDMFTQQRRPVGPLNEQGEFQQSDEKGNGYKRFNEGSWNNFFSGDVWSIDNIKKGMENWLENPEREMPAILPDLAFDSKEEELAFAKSMVDNPYTTALTTLLLRKPGGATGALVRKILEKAGPKTIVLGTLAWNAAEEQGYDMSNFVKESVSSGKDKLGELLSKGKEVIGGEASWNTLWDGVTNPAEEETVGAVTKTDGTETDDTKTGVENSDTVGGGGWVDDLHKPIPGGAGVWDTNFNRGMEMLEHAGTPLSKRGDHPSKGWRASDTAARKAMADVAKARLAANSKSIFGKVGQSSIEDSIKDDVFKALGGDALFRLDPSDEELEQTIAEAAIAIQMLVGNGMEYSMARDTVIKAIK